MTSPEMNRRDFIKTTGLSLAALGSFQFANAANAEEKKPLYSISIAEWSLHKTLFAKVIHHIDFPRVAREAFEIDAIEHVNQFFKDKVKDQAYLSELKHRADNEGVKSLLIMIDGEGSLGDPDDTKRTQAVENHYKWVEAAKFLGCHSIRVNARSAGSYDEQMSLAADGLRRLTEFGQQHDINVIVENHGGISSNGEWLAGVMKKVDHPGCGTLPDFGNFLMDRAKDEWYDRYKGVKELMPYAKAVSAKSHDFDKEGNEIRTDYHRMMKIVVDAGFDGYVGIEYEGSVDSEIVGIKKTKKLLERVRDELS